MPTVVLTTGGSRFLCDWSSILPGTVVCGGVPADFFEAKHLLLNYVKYLTGSNLLPFKLKLLKVVAKCSHFATTKIIEINLYLVSS
ncbi:hypothetical protein [Ligilactobacillus salivarius]|uniref:Uncharacterized protein n=1 Tax=Ligilactobacillus salivarius TaxID=1624 RepID=A0A921IEC9_9LACO|nr:hypothetical protein [Ligilactobacillus salivarius]MDM8284576.1 hypothetical protein [Ligilactobacillus salivarius]MDW3022900.1 hypothetical protein [Ligilactobacillus salivarius]HJG15484.1 hypothetical protein [Ligilactobacillus salivarius]